MPLSPDEIIPAIRSGQCKKADIPNFGNSYYFVDPEGDVYSLNNPAEPKVLDKKLGDGLLWVTLFDRDGMIRKFMVGDVVAYTFLDKAEKDESETTVIYQDGDVENNSVGNLIWGTPQQQQNQLRASQLGADRSKAKQSCEDQEALKGISNEEIRSDETEAAIPFVAKRQVDPMIEQLHLVQRRLEVSESRQVALREALRPFAEFNLSPGHAIDTGTAVVVESNKGLNGHSKLTVQHFRFAKAMLSSSATEETHQLSNHHG